MLSSPRVRRWLEHLLHTHDTPQRTAFAFGLGVFFGFSPLLGLHTILGLVFAFALNLNRVAVLVGIYSNLPWIVPAYYTVATVVGAAILRVQVPPGVLTEMTSALSYASWADFRNLARTLAPLVWAFFLGSTIGAVVLALVAYRVSLATIVAHRRRVEHHQPKPGQ